jgi:hypothetical protein
LQSVAYTNPWFGRQTNVPASIIDTLICPLDDGGEWRTFLSHDLQSDLLAPSDEMALGCGRQK